MNAELIRKLRLATGMNAAVLNPPADYDIIGELGLPASCGHPADAELAEGSFDYAHLFVASLAELERDAPAAIRCLKEDGLFWISYPKGTSGIKTDINRDTGWQLMRSMGMEGVANVSVNEVWSAMRYRPAGAAAKRPSRSKSGGGAAGAETAKAAAPTMADVPAMPDDVAEALRLSAAAGSFYESLTAAMKRDYLRWILEAKREETRAKRIAAMVEKLEKGLKRPTDK